MTKKPSPGKLLRNRYRVTDDSAVFVTFQRIDESQPTASGSLVEISSTSARILSNVPFQFGEKLVLCLAPEPMGYSISIGCDVQSIRHINDEEWIVQCLFGSQLEPSLLEAYVARGLLERRETARHDVSLPATVLFEGGSEWSDISLYNVGAGGFCFVSTNKGTIGSRVRLVTADRKEEELEARIMWQSEHGKEYRIGCQWVNHKGNAYASQFASTESEQEPTAPRSTRPLLMAFAIAVIAFYLGTFFSNGTALISLLR